MTQTFSDLGLAERILRALDTAGFTIPTPIQSQAIPDVLKGRDLFGIAQTGTGKTAAFALPILHHLVTDPKPALRKGCRALVLSPTRELASQIAEAFKVLGRHTNLRVTTVFGGMGHGPQIRALAGGVDILVATPGRLIDHIEAGHCDLSGTGILVLDEADQMLDLGFLKPIRTITARTSHRRQSLFFSATLPKEIESLASEMLRDPVSVRVTPVSTTAERINQRVLHVERGHKPAVLSNLLGDTAMVRTLVFTRTKRGADRVAKHLTAGGHKASAIHGNKSQNQRQQALDAFKSSKIHVLVATDIAARGIDISQVTHVVNYDLPEVPESYVHRIGRTARAGNEGEAISLVDPSERGLLRDIERLTRQTIPSARMAAPTVSAGNAADAVEAAIAAEVDDIEDDRFERRQARGNGNGGGRGRGDRNNGPRTGMGRGGHARSNGGERGGERRPAPRAEDHSRDERPREERPRDDRRASAARGNSQDGGRPAGRGPARFEDGARGERRSDVRPRADRRDDAERGASRDGGRPAGRGPARFDDGARGERQRDERPRGERRDNAERGTPQDGGRPAGRGPARFDDASRGDRRRDERPRGERRDNAERGTPRDGGRPAGRGPVRFEDGSRGERRRDERPRGERRDNAERGTPRDGGAPAGRGPVRFEDGSRGHQRQRDERPRGERRDDAERGAPREGGRPAGRGPARFEDGARGQQRRDDRPRSDFGRNDRGNADGNRGRSRPGGPRHGRPQREVV